jgi:hypothetical protein
MYGALRFALWLAVVAIALFPTIYRIKGEIHVADALTVINAQANFRDLLFAIVPAVALPISTTADFLCVNRDSEVEKISAVAAVLANVFFLAAGFVGFLTISPDTALPPAQFASYSWVLVIGMTVSGVTEVWISVASKRQHRLHERNWNDLRRVKARVKVLESR